MDHDQIEVPSIEVRVPSSKTQMMTTNLNRIDKIHLSTTLEHVHCCALCYQELCSYQSYT